MNNRKLPGGAMSKRPLHFIFLLDASGSMNADGKIEALNTAIRVAIPAMREAAAKNPGVQLLVRAITFATGARWHLAEATAIDSLRWTDVVAGGETHMGKALEMAADALKEEHMGARALPPVLILVSDGRPNDDFNSGLAKLMAEPWGQAAVREAVPIGSDAGLKYLQRFIGDDERKPVPATRPEALVERIRVVSTAAIQMASGPLKPGPGLEEPAEDTSGSIW